MPVVKSEEMGKTMSSTAKVTEPQEQKKSPFRKLLARLQLCPHTSGKISPKKSKKEEPVPPRPPLQIPSENTREKKTEWTSASLQVPENSPTKFQPEIETPIPPPRRHKVRNQDSIESIEAIHVSENMQSGSPQPVSEPIITAKKVIEHVCDGSHHHVHNVVNGVVIDEDIVCKDQVTNENQSQNLKLSSLSLPSYNDSKKKEEKRRSEKATKNKKKSSSSSLPTDKKTKPNSAAEKIESYIRRWKSVSSFRPQKNRTKTEKSKPIEAELDKSSENSWGGLDDWDVGIIENDIHTGSNVKQTTAKNTSTPKSKDEKPAKLNTRDLDRFISYVEKDVSDNRISMLTDISSDTCKDFSEPNDMPELTLPSEKEIPLPKPKPLTRKRTFEIDAEVTSEFLKHEAMSSSKQFPGKHLRMAPLATFDNDRDINKLLNTENSIVKKQETSQNSEKSVSLSNILQDNSNKQNGDLKKDGKVPVKIPRKKTIGHSSLLKYMKETNITNPEKTSETNTHIKDEEKIIMKTDKVNNDDELNIDEPKIIPEIRTLENSWQDLVQRDDAGKLSSMLELESAISDSLDNSSEDTKSTVVEAAIKCT